MIQNIVIAMDMATLPMMRAVDPWMKRGANDLMDYKDK